MSKRMTYAENLLKWKVGCFNIDATRVGGSDVAGTRREPIKHKHNEAFDKLVGGYSKMGSVNDDYLKGRFPANLILSHTPECEYLGVEEETICGGTSPDNSDKDKEDASGYYNPPMKFESITKVAKYSCSPDCPCRLMDEQAPNAGGGSKSREANMEYSDTTIVNIGSRKSGFTISDSGGASRFFIQIESEPNE